MSYPDRAPRSKTRRADCAAMRYTEKVMPVCPVTEKRAMSGNRVSHANNKTKRRFEVNLHEQRFWVPSEKRWVRLRISAKAIKTIDKLGIEAVLLGMRKNGVKV